MKVNEGGNTVGKLRYIVTMIVAVPLWMMPALHLQAAIQWLSAGAPCQGEILVQGTEKPASSAGTGTCDCQQACAGDRVCAAYCSPSGATAGPGPQAGRPAVLRADFVARRVRGLMQQAGCEKPFRPPRAVVA